MFPRFFHVFLGPSQVHIIVNDAVAAKAILKTAEPKPLDFGGYFNALPWLGEGLLISRGKKWARNRRLITPAFHFDILKPYMKVNNECADLFVDKIGKAAKQDGLFEFYGHVSLYTFDVILRCAMSYVTDIQTKGKSHPYVTAVDALGDLWVKRVLTPWKHFNLLYNFSQDGKDFKRHCDYVHGTAEEVIKKRQQTLALEPDAKRTGRYLDFLDILLKAKDEDGQGLTFQEIRDEVDTFMFEGHDTTASAISWTIYSLAGHPEYQTKCQEEIDRVLGSKDEVTWENLSEFKYVTQCIKEAMRLHCPVPFISRRLTKDMIIDGRTLPEGSIVDIQIYNLHHNPTIWDETMEYRPSRFDPDNVEKMDSFAYVPFSAGPRNCIGQNFAMHEIKTIIARIFKRFELALDPDFKVEKKVGVVMKTANGMQLKVKPRTPK